MALTLIIGGARSGKSDLAQQLAVGSGRRVLFVATMEPGDDEMRARIDAHRAARPVSWQTVEEPLALLDALHAHARAGEFVLIDCVTLWISNLLLYGIDDAERAAPAEVHESAFAAVELANRLAEWSAAFDGEVVAVTNEVGSGVVPAYALGRAYRDALGGANRALAARAERVHYAIAGLSLELKSLGATAIKRTDGVIE